MVSEILTIRPIPRYNARLQAQKDDSDTKNKFDHIILDYLRAVLVGADFSIGVLVMIALGSFLKVSPSYDIRFRPQEQKLQQLSNAVGQPIGKHDLQQYSGYKELYPEVDIVEMHVCLFCL